ncbi:MAG: cadherin domain-containing protein [Cyanobacteria bacterium J06621_12]
MAIIQLTNNGNSKSPDIFGNEIVWIENRRDLILFDGNSTALVPGTGEELVTNPQISGEGILWNAYINKWQILYHDGNETVQLTDEYSVDDEKLVGNQIAWRSAPSFSPGGEQFEVYLYDGSNQVTQQLTDNNVRENSVDTSGQNVVWKGASNTVYLYDGTDTTTLTDNGVSPLISGNQVVWESYTGGRKDQINLYDGDSIIQIANDDSVWLQGFFDGNVVWSQWDGNDYELFRYDGSTTLQITDNDFHDRLNPNSTLDLLSATITTAVDGSGDNLVWSSYVDDNWEVFYYDGMETIQLTDNDVDDLNPKISGNKVVWNTNGESSDVFLYDPDIDTNSAALTEDFESDLGNSQWKKIKNAIANDNFKGSGESLFFSGGQSGGGARFATSNALDLTGESFVFFDLIFGNSENGGENVDPGEDVVLEYSLDNGLKWSAIATYDTEEYTSWSTIVETIPDVAQTPATNLRWRQIAQSGSNFDNWGLDNINVSTELPNFAPDGIDATFELEENSPNQTLIGMVIVDDANLDQSMTYSIESGNDAGAFEINGNGELTVVDSAPLDYEAMPSFELEIEVRDNGAPSLSDTVLITVDLIDVYEGAILNFLTEDFQPDINDNQWNRVGSSMVNEKFAGDGQSLFFTGGKGNDDSRHLTTTGVNVANGGEISFDLIFGDRSNGGENADASEDVALEFSTDNGRNWSEIAIYDTEAYTSWTGISEAIPDAAQTDQTLFRWTQVQHSGSRFDNWGLDNISIEPIDDLAS